MRNFLRKLGTIALVLTLLVGFSPGSVIAGIEFDNATSAINNSDTTSLTFSHTNTGSDVVLVVGSSLGNQATFSGVTYNGVSMTLIDSCKITPDTDTALWYLADPATGANNVVISWDIAGNSGSSGYATSFTGADTSDPIDTFGKDCGTDATVSVGLTTTNDNSFMVDTMTSNNSTVNIGAGQTQRHSNTMGSGQRRRGSTEPTTTAGSYTMSWTLGGGDRNSGIAVAINEAPSVGAPSGTTMVMGMTF